MKLSSGSIGISSIAIASALFIFQLIKDFVESKVKGFEYVYAESFGFSMIWLLFIPLTWVIRRYTCYEGSKRRIFLVTFIFGVVHIFVFAIWIFFFSSLVLETAFNIFGNFKFGLLEHFLIIWVLYGFLFIALSHFDRRDIKPSPTTYVSQLLLTKSGVNDVIPISKVISIHASTPYVQIITHEKKYLEQTSLKELQRHLDPNIFIRIHKSTIINKNHIISYTSRMNGDYDIIVTNGAQVRMSRNYVPHFKNVLMHDKTIS